MRRWAQAYGTQIPLLVGSAQCLKDLGPTEVTGLYRAELRYLIQAGAFRSSSDAEALKAGQPRAELAIWDGVNHVLKVAPAERAANIATYMDPALSLAPGVVEAVADFVLK